ncbi:ATP-binding protein [Cerasicoccus frondis]|uniref:ATP-binding protein n=1 Tax=Cerasicoccus frondis TaxID=490090 RepID=UPI0028529EBC|nr:ATP-binding protein [Cerasicoccus frondis]
MADSTKWCSLLRETRDLSECKSCLADFLRDASTPEGAVADALLAAEEIIINVLQHASLPEGGVIELSCTVRGSVLMTIVDPCAQFNPLLEVPQPDLAADDAVRVEGGFGFYIVREIAESIEYNRRGNRNVLSVKMPAFSTISS